MISEDRLCIDEGADGWRLDRALELLLPGTSLRFRRRLCNDGRILVDGSERKPGFKVRPGQEVLLKEGERGFSARDLGVRLIRREGDFAALDKPGEVHSAAIAGREDPSVESVLPELFPDMDPLLLNRLDYLTAGLLLVGLTPQVRDAYLEYEDEGAIRKFYLARVVGRLDGMVTIRSGLDTDDRKKTRVLGAPDRDTRRWTDVTVLSHDHAADTTLVRCLIMKGARHQIRAHLASVGHPIVGDPLYGTGKSPRGLMLQHQRIEMPGFSAETTPRF